MNEYTAPRRKGTAGPRVHSLHDWLFSAPPFHRRKALREPPLSLPRARVRHGVRLARSPVAEHTHCSTTLHTSHHVLVTATAAYTGIQGGTLTHALTEWTAICVDIHTHILTCYFSHHLTLSFDEAWARERERAPAERD